MSYARAASRKACVVLDRRVRGASLMPALVRRRIVGPCSRCRGMAQLGSASALGAEGRRFKSCYPDGVVSGREDPSARSARWIVTPLRGDPHRLVGSLHVRQRPRRRATSMRIDRPRRPLRPAGATWCPPAPGRSACQARWRTGRRSPPETSLSRAGSPARRRFRRTPTSPGDRCARPRARGPRRPGRPCAPRATRGRGAGGPSRTPRRRRRARSWR